MIKRLSTFILIVVTEHIYSDFLDYHHFRESNYEVPYGLPFVDRSTGAMENFRVLFLKFRCRPIYENVPILASG